MMLQSILVRFQRLDRLGQFGLSQRSAVVHTCRNTGLRIESLVLQEEHNPLGRRIAGLR